MNINRNNYEEYFLLYADNELTDFEKAEVLMFLKENKDLEEEFRMIHQTICKADAGIELDDKSFLLRGNAASFINEKNYEEVFVLYHDNELTAAQKRDTEHFLLLHTKLRSEFELIRLAKLIPENTVIFPNKRKLYKKEKAGKVVPIIFWRSLAAAIFIGLGLWTVQIYIKKGSEEKPGIATHLVPVKKPEVVIPKEVLPEKKPLNTIVRSRRNSQPSLAAKNEKDKFQKSLPQKNANNVLVKTSPGKQKVNEENLIRQSPEEISNEDIVANDKIKNIPKEQIKGDNAMESTRELAQNTIKADEAVQPVMYARNASYIPDANNNAQNYVFYDITTEEFKKTKVSGFLKKVKRVIERNNPISRLLSGDEKQVVSN